MSEKINFLNQGIKQTKKSIRDIDDSYNNEWDILAELCQNAVDAIKRRATKHGEISILIDSKSKTIRVSDNGCGISSDRLPVLLAPFSTDKEEDDISVGEKGVGLTFVIFTCNHFYIKSGDGKTTSEGTILDACRWKESNNLDVLELSHKIIDEDIIGTTIELKEVAVETLFQLSFSQLKYLLRTKTALGNTSSIWEKDINIDISFKHRNLDGIETEEKIPFEYLLPTEGFNPRSIVVLDDFFEYIKHDRTDKEKREKLFGKIIYKKGKFEHNGRTIKFWTCYVPQRKTWNDISIKNNLATQELLIDNTDWVEQHNYALFHSGIYTSVKGMPTGISVNNPITGFLGYWAHIFILFDDRYIKFDIGRKALPGRQSEIFKKKAKEIFNEYTKIFRYIGRNEVEENPEWEKSDIFTKIDEEINLNNPISKFVKSPGKQEASVAGLFYECIGNGLIKDINPLLSGYKGKYDLYAKWGNRQIVIEFKSKLQKILNDFTDEVKMFNELDCIVCWNVDEEDERAFKRKQIELIELEPNELNNRVMFPNATHRLTLAFVNPIYIIDLKKVLQNAS